MIYVGVGDKDLLDALDLSRRQHRDISEIEQKRMLLEQRFDIDGWVAVSVIDKTGVQKGPHCAGLDHGLGDGPNDAERVQAFACRGH